MNDEQYDRKLDLRFFMLAMLVFAALSAWAAKASDGFVEADGCTHYLYARFAVTHPYLLVNVWGRPLVTGLNALPAYYGGRLGVRFASLAMALICAIATYRIAVGQKYRLPALAVIGLFAQPLFFVHSFAELTELPFAMVVILAFWAYQKRLWMVMTVLLAITPLGRPEGFGFVLAAAFALICHRRWWWLIILPMPLVIWSWVGWVSYGLPGDMKWWQWLIRNWPYEAQSNYGSGPIYHYLMYLPAVVGALLVPAACVGVWWCLRYGKLFGTYTIPRFAPAPSPGTPRESGSEGTPAERNVMQPPAVGPHLNALPEYRESEQENHRRTCDFVIAALPVGILFVHSVFWFFGKFSGGELRYLLVVGPFWGLTAARGWEWICRRASAKWTLIAATMLAVMPAAVNLAYTVVPIRYSGDEMVARQITDWYKRDAGVRNRYPIVMSPQPTFFYLMDLCPTGDPGMISWSRERVEHPPAGTMMVYEKILATFNSDKKLVIDPDTSLTMGGWVLIREFDNGWKVYLSPKDAAGNASTPESLSTLP